MVYLELISPPGLLGYFLRVSVSTYREWSPFADKQPTSTHPIMTSHIQRLKSFKISFKNCPDHRTPLIFSEIAGTHQISWRTYLLKKDSKRLELCAQIVLFIPIRSNNRLSSLLRTFVRMIRMSASWPLANGATMCTDIKVKWTVIKMRLSCWAIPKKPLEKPMYFEYLYWLIQSLLYRKSSISTQNAGILKYSSEAVSRNSPSTSASFARNKALRGCG